MRLVIFNNKEQTKLMKETIISNFLHSQISLLDVDKSGKIEEEEFISWWMEKGGDIDGDGKIDETEAKLGHVAHHGFEKACVFYIESMREDR